MTDSNSLLERLRKFPRFWLNGAAWMMGTEPEPLCVEAADAIERLHAQNEVLTNGALNYALEINRLRRERDEAIKYRDDEFQLRDHLATENQRLRAMVRGLRADPSVCEEVQACAQCGGIFHTTGECKAEETSGG